MILKQLLWAYSNKPCLTSSISLFDKASGLAARKGKWDMCCIFTWITPAHAATKGNSLDNVTTRWTCEWVVYAQGVMFIISPARCVPDSHHRGNTDSRNLGEEAGGCVSVCVQGWKMQGERVTFTQEITVSKKWPQFPMLYSKSWHSWSYFPYKTCAPPTSSAAFNERNT